MKDKLSIQYIDTKGNNIKPPKINLSKEENNSIKGLNKLKRNFITLFSDDAFWDYKDFDYELLPESFKESLEDLFIELIKKQKEDLDKFTEAERDEWLLFQIKEILHLKDSLKFQDLTIESQKFYYRLFLFIKREIYCSSNELILEQRNEFNEQILTESIEVKEGTKERKKLEINRDNASIENLIPEVTIREPLIKVFENKDIIEGEYFTSYTGKVSEIHALADALAELGYIDRSHSSNVRRAGIARSFKMDGQIYNTGQNKLAKDHKEMIKYYKTQIPAKEILVKQLQKK